MKPTGLKRGKADRKFGRKLFLKPYRGLTPKAAFTRRSYKPGMHGQDRVRNRSRSPEYGLQLLEKQRVRVIYGVSDKAFKRIVRDAEARVTRIEGTNNVLDLITEVLELRLDNVVFRAGLAPSRSMARQYVSHGHVLVNGKRLRVRSAALKRGDVVSVRFESRGKAPFQEVQETILKYKSPKWLDVDVKMLAAKIVGMPNREEAMADVELSKIVEFYAR